MSTSEPAWFKSSYSTGPQLARSPATWTKFIRTV